MRTIANARRLFILSGLLLVLSSSFAPPLLARQGPLKRIKVYVTIAASKSEFVDTKANEREQAARDLRESIAKKRKDWLEVVDRPEEADIRLEVVDRFMKDTGETETTTTATASTNKEGDSSYGTASTTSRQKYAYVLVTRLMVGEHTEELSGAIGESYMFGGPWRTTANQVTDQTEKFARNNYDTLLKRRSK